ncbi:LysR family transcriptional regulator [Paenibacillus chitinolyticus]
MTITQFQVFVKIAETGSFTKAGLELNMTQPAVSHAISSLEADLGIHLMIRDRKNGITLTHIGKRVLIQMREILQRVENIEQEIAAEKGLEVGTVRIGAFPTAAAHFLPKIMSTFKQKYPNLQLVLHEGTIAEVKEWLSTRFIDVGLVIFPDADLEIVPLFRDKMVAVLPENHVLAGRSSLTMSDLSGEPMILCRGGYEAPIIDLFQKSGADLRLAFAASNVATVLNMIREGLGLAILSRLSLSALPPGLVTLDLEPRVCRDISVAVPSLKEASLAVHLFIQTARELFPRE